MGFNFRKRGSNGTNVSWSSRGPRISQSMKFGNVSVNVGKTLGQKPTIRTRVNLGNGMFYTKSKTIGADQRKVNKNLSNAFDVPDTSVFDDMRSEEPSWYRMEINVNVSILLLGIIFYIPYALGTLGMLINWMVAACVITCSIAMSWYVFLNTNITDIEWYDIPALFAHQAVRGIVAGITNVAIAIVAIAALIAFAGGIIYGGFSLLGWLISHVG